MRQQYNLPSKRDGIAIAAADAAASSAGRDHHENDDPSLSRRLPPRSFTTTRSSSSSSSSNLSLKKTMAMAIGLAWNCWTATTNTTTLAFVIIPRTPPLPPTSSSSSPFTKDTIIGVTCPSASRKTTRRNMVLMFEDESKPLIRNKKTSLSSPPKTSTDKKDDGESNVVVAPAAPAVGASPGGDGGGGGVKDSKGNEIRVGSKVRVVAAENEQQLRAYQVSSDGYGRFDSTTRQFVPATPEETATRAGKCLSIPPGMCGVVIKMIDTNSGETGGLSANFPIQVQFVPAAGDDEQSEYDPPVKFSMHLGPDEIECLVDE